jgi:uncharacterized FlaG/YvyC family protein
MLVVIFFRPVSILYVSLVWFRLLLLTSDRRLVSCVSTSFSICFTKQVTDETRELLVSLSEKQKEVAEYQTNIVYIKKYASDLQTFIAVKQIQKEVETQDTSLRSLVNSDILNQTVTCFSASSNSIIRFSCNLSRWLLICVLSSCVSFSIIRFCSLTELELFSLFWWDRAFD